MRLGGYIQPFIFVHTINYLLINSCMFYLERVWNLFEFAGIGHVLLGSLRRDATQIDTCIPPLLCHALLIKIIISSILLAPRVTEVGIASYSFFVFIFLFTF